MRLPQPGEAVGPYTCLRLLASGGMGAVYEARHPDLPRSVALKLLLAPDDPDLVARFHREAEACGRLNHPNLVRVHDSGSVGLACYLVMELVQGESLQALLDRSGPVAPDQAQAWISQATAGIAHAHQAGVLHRDLKPSNILWESGSGRVCVVDFGLTGRLSAADSLTATGEVLGTPGYLAPEQVGAFEGRTGPRTDVYGLGATLFALLTGRSPFLGAGLAGLAEVAEEPAPDVRSLRAEVSPELAALVARCLEKDPASRPASVSQLGDVLAGRAEAGLPARPRRRPLLWAGVLVLGALLLAAGLAFEEASAGPRSAEAYAAWRAGAGEGFAYGWGDLESGYAEALESWGRELDESPAPTHEPWRRARRDLRAQLRLIAAAGGADSGFPEGGPSQEEGLEAGPEDYLAQAVIDLRAGRLSEAATAFEFVRGPLSATQAASRTRLALEARLEPQRFLRSLPERSSAGLNRARAEFGAALRLAAPKVSQADLLGWFSFAQRRGWSEAPQALREAIAASCGRREQELRAARPRDRAALVRALCAPLRAAELWPDPGFRATARTLLSREISEVQALPHSDRARRERVLALVRFEHELFYRVEPTPCWEVDYLRLAGEPGMSEVVLHPSVSRTLYRYGIHPGGFGLQESEYALMRLGGAWERGSRLDRAFTWMRDFADHTSLPEGGCARAQRELHALLTTGIRDLPPHFVQLLFQHLRVLWAYVSPFKIRPTLAEAEQLFALSQLEFEATLPWWRHFPQRTASEDLGRLAFAGTWPYFYLDDVQAHLPRALEGFAERARGLEALARSETAPGDLSHGITIMYGGLAEYARLQGVGPLAEPYLERGRAHMATQRQRYWEFSQYWSLLLDLQRPRDPERALELVDSLRLPLEARDPFLALAVARVLEGTPGASRALSGLQRALAWLDQYGGSAAEPEALRRAVLAQIESCSR